MASPETIVLLTVDYHAAIGGGKTPVPLSLVCAPEDDDDEEEEDDVDDDDEDDGQR